MNTPVQTVVTHDTKATAHPSLREIGKMVLKIPGAMGKALIGQDSFTQQVAHEAKQRKGKY